MSTAKQFRVNRLWQLEESLNTGLSSDMLLEEFSEYSGQKHVVNDLSKLHLQYSIEEEIPFFFVDALREHFDIALNILGKSACGLEGLAAKITPYNGNKQLRNLDDCRPVLSDPFDRMTVSLARGLLDALEASIGYMGEQYDMVDKEGAPLSELGQAGYVYDILNAAPSGAITFGDYLLVLHYAVSNMEKSANEFLEDFPTQELYDESFSVDLLREILPIAAEIKEIGLKPSTDARDKPRGYQDILSGILDLITCDEAGRWTRPWADGTFKGRPRNYRTKNKYRGRNVLLLWKSASVNSFDSPFWATKKQWQQSGFQVAANQDPSAVVYSFRKKAVIDDEANIKGDDEEERYERQWGHRAYKVYNACQLEEFDHNRAEFVPEIDENLPAAFEDYGEVDTFVNATYADLRHGGGIAYYHLKNDYIQMPERQKFIDTVRETAAQGYYATLLHELTHWTGNSIRCDRSYPEKSSYEAYAFEELVAEIGAAFLCGDLGVLNVPRDWAEENDVSNPPQGQEYGQLQNHAAYLHSWIKALKDKDHPERMLVAAASLAEKAIDHLEGLQPKK